MEVLNSTRTEKSKSSKGRGDLQSILSFKLPVSTKTQSKFRVCSALFDVLTYCILSLFWGEGSPLYVQRGSGICGRHNLLKQSYSTVRFLLSLLYLLSQRRPLLLGQQKELLREAVRDLTELKSQRAGPRSAERNRDPGILVVWSE